MGISIQLVSLRGRPPICHGCQATIDRGSERLVVKTRAGMALWSTTRSFHLNIECVDHSLTVSEKEDFTRLLKADAELKKYFM
jgi:hypothetical protein